MGGGRKNGLPGPNGGLARPARRNRPLKRNRPRKQPPSLSILERLPVEILEDIFLRSGNLNLVRAAPNLGRRLSSEYVRREFVASLFQSHPYAMDVHGDAYFKDRHRLPSGNLSWLFTQKWMTLPFLQRCEETYMARWILYDQLLPMVSKYGKIHWLETYGPEISTQSYGRILRFLHHHRETSPSGLDIWDKSLEWTWREGTPSRPSTTKGPSRLPTELELAAPWLPRELKLKFIYPRAISVSLEIVKNQYSAESIGKIGVAFDCQRVQLPSRVLRGPWTTEKTDVLNYLLQCGAGVDYARTTQGEEIERGLMEAIDEGNTLAVQLLLEGVPPNGSYEEVFSDDFVWTETKKPYSGALFPAQRRHLLHALRRGSNEVILEAILDSANERGCPIDLLAPEMIVLPERMARHDHPLLDWLSARMIREEELRTGGAVGR